MIRRRSAVLALALFTAPLAPLLFAASPAPTLIRSAHSGNWSDPATWENQHLPAPGDSVQVRPQDHVRYDIATTAPFHMVDVAGTLSFATDRDTRMDVGLLLVRPGNDTAVPNMDSCTAQAPEAVPDHGDDQTGHATGDAPSPNQPQPALLEIGTADNPLPASHHALIRLTPMPNEDPSQWPALLVCTGGRLEFHGAPLSPTWLKLQSTAHPGDSTITLSEPVVGWQVGDHLLLPTTAHIPMFKNDEPIPTVKTDSQTEERTLTAVQGTTLTLDKPLRFEHLVHGVFRGEVADLSRNIVVESADLALRGHTMYHHGTRVSINYAEFRHLGKENTLGRYALHFHRCGDSARGSSVIGASIWDSANRWITVHHTNFLVVRDCIGYQSIGHGFFMEDGTEEYNDFDHNLAVQALKGKPLPNQFLPFDHNDGSGFWWINSRNSFTRNDAVECDQYGYRFEAGHSPEFDSKLTVRQPDGRYAVSDVRTLPFIRFEDNEAHSQRRFALDLGGIRMVAGNDAYLSDSAGKRTGLNYAETNIGDVGDAGPDIHHPFIIKNFRVWTSEWAFHSYSPSVLIDGLSVYDTDYGIWRSRVTGALYRHLSFEKMRVAEIFMPFGGADDYDERVNPFLKPVDDFPPTSIITSVEHPAAGGLRVTGTCIDNGPVKQVLVNGQPATPLAPNFAQWTIDFPPDVAAHFTRVTSTATDAKGNVEPTPHTLNPLP